MKYLWQVNMKIKGVNEEIVSYICSKSFVHTDAHLHVPLTVGNMLSVSVRIYMQLLQNETLHG